MKVVNMHGSVPDAGDEGRDPLDLTVHVDVLLRYRWTFLAVAGMFICVGMLYALLATPLYRTDILVQVEDINGDASAGRLATNISPIFDAKLVAAAEIELLRSRMVVGKAVDDLRLDIEAAARYFPLIGRGLASFSSGLSTPGLFGWGGFAWGKESISVARLEVPPQMEGSKIYLTALGGNQFRVTFDSDDTKVTGTVGLPLKIATGRGTVTLLVSHLDGRAGCKFVLRRLPRATAIARLQEQLMISERGKESGVIGVSLNGNSPTMIAAILNEIAGAYVDQNVRRKAAEAEKSLAFLEQQLPQLREQVEEAETRYNAMRSQRGTIDLGEESKLVLVQSMQIQTRLQELHRQRQELATRFTNGHPALEAIDGQIGRLNAQINAIAGQIQKLPDVEQHVLRLMRDVKVSTEMLQSLLNDIQHLKLIKASKVGTARLVDPAGVPVKPESPNRPLITGLSIVLGLFAGLLVIIARHSLDGGVNDADEVERQTGMTVYSTIPFSAQQAQVQSAGMEDAGLLARVMPKDPAMESLRIFRTVLQSALAGSDNRVVVISSPSPGVGKSFICANLAAIAASGCRVVLIDADLRRGGLHHCFGVQRSPGLADVLMGMPPDRALRRQVVKGLDFIATGMEAPHAADMLQSAGMGALLDALRSRYDLVVIDTPPVLAAADAGILAGKADAVFLVARAEMTTAGELRASQQAIRRAGAEVEGVLFNGPHVQGRWYRSHNHYGKYRYLNEYRCAAKQA
ncbi:Polysaccharide biosynthesis tyrosine autokinase [Cupriavidus necator]|uniref:Polysaccharide biosynthesis tyrosine autokinase n=1 Tax=Cupriavidus necator (strain ATCC 17699 / DSM 428 / KCTC 22496 / NCIMB 10442 / H16 / Stanier 337) TaxID=381666 RepID=Q0K582_CUPNH|nr:polysaccharide biosynthesis tyrosine autokinase [Cupriavidus necator]QCC02789.1 polysaccharide biosynthesis tyrosine autokinase [Cupriavidus necator H16]QQB79841.1 polysaccharide biosynthesis tyrosine autokinase [Cupriavidus necator]WKA44089.1 polysaccharide biosynthesis tyrosine autokinase [Cupriavidus necator]CAJ94842.1 putative exopolysaccharide biosynthesis protein [Cupriavidus necator H16]